MSGFCLLSQYPLGTEDGESLPLSHCLQTSLVATCLCVMAQHLLEHSRQLGELAFEQLIQQAVPGHQQRLAIMAALPGLNICGEEKTPEQW